MNEEQLTASLRDICGTENVLEKEPMSAHTSFRIGGPADLFLRPCDENALANSIDLLRTENIPWTVIGNGTNLLVSDEGYRGAVIQLWKNYSGLRCSGREIYAQAGAMLSAVSHLALENSLTGLEFASGIPGTVGGAILMNAGAYGGEMKDAAVYVRVLTDGGCVRTVRAEDMEFGYRTSAVTKNHWIVLEACLALTPGDPGEIRAKMEDLKNRRTEKQPLNLPSAGSTFKRPEGYFAGKLIMDAGLRGYRVGGAQISEKHCGFVVNTGNATAADVMQLIRDVRRIVFEKSGVNLETEVKMLGEFK